MANPEERDKFDPPELSVNVITGEFQVLARVHPDSAIAYQGAGAIAGKGKISGTTIAEIGSNARRDAVDFLRLQERAARRVMNN